ncbi:PAS domain S-box protein [Methanosarcina hadiensis]|uniref:PAS domain S-box protein n=1 Tax=Methanosarcina hadiensis TaxID=3078083 RepID=UPI0039776E41
MVKYILKSSKQVNNDVIPSKGTLKPCNPVYGSNRFGNIIQEKFSLNCIFNSMVTPIVYRDKSGLYLFVNRAFEELVGIPAKEIIGLMNSEVSNNFYKHVEGRVAINEGYFQKAVDGWNKIGMEIIISGGSSALEQEIVCADRIKRTFIVNFSAFNNENGGVQGLLIILQDITGLRKSETAFEKNDEKYKIVAEQTGQLIYDFDLLTDKGSWAGAIEKVTGYSKEEFQSMSRKLWTKNIHPADREAVIKEFIESRRTGKNYRIEFRFRKKDGKCIYLENSGIHLKDNSGKPVRSLGAVKDITGRKLAEEKLQESEDKYRSFVQNLKGIAFQFDRDFKLEFMHGAVKEITGYSEEELVSSKLWPTLIVPEDLNAFKEKENKIRRFSGQFQGELDYRIRCKNGEIKWMHETYQKVPGKEGKPDVYNGIVYDITERKETEETLAKVEVARKKEVHHRIKNNLQVISSLLDLQAENLGDKRIKEVLRESQNRIMSIALIHRELYRDREMDNVNFSIYIRELAENLLDTYKVGDSKINLCMDLEENIHFDIETAVPLGIIVNEIFSNSLKYAFPDRICGEIRINLARKKAGKDECSSLNEKKEQSFGSDANLSDANFVLTVSDDGLGIPDSFNIEDAETLGLQLINVLIEQLDGSIRLNRNNGTEFIIEFAAQDCSK